MQRIIQTTYYGIDQTVVKTNRAVYARLAVLHAVDHMQMNTYSATVAEVFDLETGELHSVITHSVNDIIHILFQRDPTSPRCVVLPSSN